MNGELEKNGKRALQAGDVVNLAPKAVVQRMPAGLTLLHEDDHLIVVIKAAGLLTVASLEEKEETAQAFLNVYLEASGSQERIHVVHRLDRDSSGVLVFAKSFEIREALKERFASHDIDRIYIAVIEGVLPEDRGTFRSMLREDERTWRVRSAPNSATAKLAITHYRVIRKGTRYSLLEVTLETGRKNQIRVHLSEAGHPIAGDERYGAKTDPIGRLALHAKLLGFLHPVTGKKMTFTAPVPGGFTKLKL